MPKPEIQILVCVNERPEGSSKPCCGRRGALSVYRRFKDRVRALGRAERDRILVTRTGCLRHCSHGVTVAVWPCNTWLGGVTLDDVDEILETTVLGEGRPVPHLALSPDLPWE